MASNTASTTGRAAQTRPTAAPRVLVAESDGFSPEAAEILGRRAEVVLADLDRPALLEAVGGADVLWVRFRNRIDAPVMDAGSRLRAIVSATTGLDHIDVAEAERRGIAVLSVRGEWEFLRDVRATAELTTALILALLRRLPAAAEHARAGGWDRDAFRGRELYGATAGIVGYGRLGSRVARCLLAFEVGELLVADPNRGPEDILPGGELLPLRDLLRRSRIVSLHAPLSDSTRGMIGRAEVAAMPEGSYLVNTARGELVDEEALLDALQSGQLAGAALDVLSRETEGGTADHPLVRYAQKNDNLIITPHIGGGTVESMAKTERFMAERLLSFLGGTSDGG